MIYGETIWSSGKRITAIFNSHRNNIRREAEYRIIKRTLLKELTIELTMGDRESKLFNKSCCYFSVASEGFGGKVDRLIGRGFCTFDINGFFYATQTLMVTFVGA